MPRTKATDATPAAKPAKTNLAAALKAEFGRLARKEVASKLGPLIAANKQLKQGQAGLRQEVAELRKALKELRNPKSRRSALVTPADGDGLRFQARGLKPLRDRLGISQRELGILCGVSTGTIDNWENARAKPRASQLGMLAAVRSMGKREALKLLSDASEEST